jgi:transcription factor IIIB subunit 2
MYMCRSCHTVISDSYFVEEVSFGENAAGAPVVHGTAVHQNQWYNKATAGAFRYGARSSEDTHQANMRNAKEEMTRLANSLYIGSAVTRALHLYSIMRIHHFHRPLLESIAICLYIVCRQTKGNMTLLIDFAERIHENVYDLGAVYKKFIRATSIDKELEAIPTVEIEPLLYKYARRLEFGSSTRRVANDAASILARMDRDWIVTGRQPAALCGAALILAARMNNFRRSVRELVYIVKAADTTILKRLSEFRRTKAGQLTVANFREYSKLLRDKEEPPSVYAAREKAALKRKAAEVEEIEVEEIEPPTARLDGDGFAIPEAPKSKRGRPRKQAEEKSNSPESTESQPKKKKQRFTPSSVVLTEEDIEEEAQLEAQITQVVERLGAEDRFQVTEARAKALAEVEQARRRVGGGPSTVPDAYDIGEEEFADDPEVANCLLTESEIAVKEKIWVTHNHDWLRREQERLLDIAMDEARGKTKRKKRVRRRRGGGGAAGEGDEDESPASTPAEASQRMLQRRNVRPAFSRHINYDKLQAIYRMGDGDGRGSSEPASTRAGSVFGDERAQSVVVEEEEEEEEMESDAEAGTDEDEFQEEYDDSMEVARSEDEVDLDEVGMRDPDEY